MSLLTNFFHLIKPAKTDGVKVSDFNANMDTIDTEMHRPPLTVNEIEPNPTTRDLHIDEVPLATNLSSDIAQAIDGEFIERTSGGSASIDDGYAALVFVKGNTVHTGIVAESITSTVTVVDPTATGALDPDSIAINAETFRGVVLSSQTINFVFTTDWTVSGSVVSLATYGITITGTPAEGDTISVVYVKANRGTITAATPSSFNSTGWNLYDNSSGVKAARCVRYSDEYGYLIGGSYSLVEFAPTFSGTHESVDISDGYFTLPEGYDSGWFFVTGGDETTYIIATWTDWTEGYEGTFAAYDVDTIDLSGVMVNFSYGLLNVGNVRDEINLNAQTAISRIERVAYSTDTITTLEQNNTPYDADENYIYYVKDTPDTYSFTVDADYTVSDHGLEYFLGTSVPVITETLYGENLKDKLRTDVLTISAQELDASQQAQVRENIGAAAAGVLAGMFISNDSTFVSQTSVSFPYNSSYTCPADGLYILGITGDDGDAGIITATTSKYALMRNATGRRISGAFFLRKGTKLYSNNQSSATFAVYGYYPITI